MTQTVTNPPLSNVQIEYSTRQKNKPRKISLAGIVFLSLRFF